MTLIPSVGSEIGSQPSPDLRDNRKITKYQIWGERNSGTNYLRQIMDHNFHLSYTQEYGFKHWFIKNQEPRGPPNTTTDNECLTSLENNNEVLFIFIVRDPINWLQSMHRLPHHAPEHRDLTFGQFIRKPWICYEPHLPFDHGPDSPTPWQPNSEGRYLIETATNICTLRSMKNRHFLAVRHKVQHYVVIHQDRLKVDLQQMIEYFNLKIKYQKLELLDYRSPRPSYDIDTVDHDFILGQLDVEVEKSLGYWGGKYSPILSSKSGVKPAQNGIMPPLVFIMTRHVTNPTTDQYWKRSYTAIRKLYPQVLIVIIDDNSSFLPTENSDMTNYKVIKSEYPQRGELLPYYYFHKFKWAEKAVMIHDSVFLNRKIETKGIDKYQFLWHFDHSADHCYHPPNNIVRILSQLTNSADILRHYRGGKHLWSGSFGSMAVVKWDFLDAVNTKTDFLAVGINNIKNRTNRMTLERVIGCIFSYFGGKHRPLYGDIHTWCYCLTKGQKRFFIRYSEYMKSIEYFDSFPVMKVWSDR